MAAISVIITIYNAERTIPELIQRLQHSLATISEDYELIFIEDRGKDDSWKALKQFAAQDGRIKIARMARNFGQHNAITAGLHLAKGNYFVIMDGDLQDEPEIIPSLYQQIRETGKEIIYVKRVNRKHSGFKKFTSRLYYKIFRLLSDIKTDPDVGAFCMGTKLVRESFCKFGEVNKFIGGIFYWMNFDHGYLEAEHAARKEGKSNYNLAKLTRLAFSGIVGFSNKPLNIAIYLGFISSISSLVMGVYFMLRKILLDVKITGYTSIIVSLFFIGGLILFVLGIIGQYIGQIYEQTKRRPEFLLQEKINFNHEQQGN